MGIYIQPFQIAKFLIDKDGEQLFFRFLVRTPRDLEILNFNIRLIDPSNSSSRYFQDSTPNTFSNSVVLEKVIYTNFITDSKIIFSNFRRDVFLFWKKVEANFPKMTKFEILRGISKVKNHYLVMLHKEFASLPKCLKTVFEIKFKYTSSPVYKYDTISIETIMLMDIGKYELMISLENYLSQLVSEIVMNSASLNILKPYFKFKLSDYFL